MKIVRKCAELQNKYLGLQKFDEKIKYRQIMYCFEVFADNEYLLYNNLTDEMVVLSKEEMKSVKESDNPSEILKTLVEKWFYVPEELDETKLCDQIKQIETMFNTSLSEKYINNYVIFPTTDCNARCFYCYELGRSRKNMSPKVAADLAEFIIKSAKGKDVGLYWFGGEPLYNLKAIDTICDILKKQNITFSSKMITNGYLFDDATIEKAKSLWNLKSVQITIDGTEEIYNKVKAYIYKDDISPFKKVIKNIEILLKTGIKVDVRLNMDDHNSDDIFKLTDFLAEKFLSFKDFKLYAHLLFDDTDNKRKNRPIEEKLKLKSQHQKLSKYIDDKGFAAKFTLKDYHRKNQCMASDDHTVVVLPDGDLGRCEHFSESDFFGSIYRDKIDYGIINKYKKLLCSNDACKKCRLKPSCVALENCPHSTKCYENDIFKSYYSGLENRMINSYQKFKSNELE